MKRLSLTIDYAFKKFFVDNNDLLIDFLNAVLRPFNDFTIESLVVLNPELPGEAINDKNAILDVLARDSTGRTINIEMQAHEIDEFARRSAFYAFRLYVQALRKGQVHSEIRPVLSLNLLDFRLFPGLSYHRCFRLLDVSDPFISMMDGIEFHFIELPKLKTKVEALPDALAIWIHFIHHSATLTKEEIATMEKKNPSMIKAHAELDRLSMDSDAVLQYDRRRSVIYFYERTLEKKFEDGLEQGKEAGRAEGAHDKAIETARAMLQENDAIDKICRVTGLSTEELAGLRSHDTVPPSAPDA